MTGNTITVSYSEITSARRCALQHELNWVRGWKKEQGDSSALTIGIAWHAMLNHYYEGIKAGWPLEECDGVARDYVAYRVGEPIQEQLLWMFDGYVERYGLEPGWTVLDVERAVLVPLPQLHPDLKVILKIKIDLIIQDPRGHVWVDDHKTAATLPNENTRIDDQLPLYVFGLRAIGEEVYGARYSYARKSKPKVKVLTLQERFSRREERKTEVEVGRAAINAYLTARSRYRDQCEIEQMRERLGPSGQKLWPAATQQEDCSWRCDFATPCKAYHKGYNLEEQLRERSEYSSWREAKGLPPKRPELI